MSQGDNIGDIMKKMILIISLMLTSTLAFAADNRQLPVGHSINAANSRQALISQLLKKSQTKAPVPTERQPTRYPETFHKMEDMSNNMFAPAGNHMNSAVNTPAVSNAELGDQSFANMTRSMLPLTPEQITELHQMYNQSRKAVANYPGVPPKPTSSSVVPDLSPGATPPVIRLASGFITSMDFLDSTGQPWPISAVDVGDPKSFNVQWNHKGNTLLIQALNAYKPGNLAVILKGMNTPVMFTLLPGQTAVDYRVDVRVPRLGPNANASLVSGLPGASSPELLNALDGIPPTGSKALEVKGGDVQVWQVGNKLYIRTRMTLLSPSWISTMSSGDGTHAYLLQEAPILLALHHGKIIRLEIKGL